MQIEMCKFILIIEISLNFFFESWLVTVSSALVRPGRFDVSVKVDVPDLKGRNEILNHYVKKIKIAPGIENRNHLILIQFLFLTL